MDVNLDRARKALVEFAKLHRTLNEEEGKLFMEGYLTCDKEWRKIEETEGHIAARSWFVKRMLDAWDMRT